jgi:hypothetical protein
LGSTSGLRALESLFLFQVFKKFWDLQGLVYKKLNQKLYDLGYLNKLIHVYINSYNIPNKYVGVRRKFLFLYFFERLIQFWVGSFRTKQVFASVKGFASSLFVSYFRFLLSAYMVNSVRFLKNRSIKWQLKKSKYDRALKTVFKVLKLVNAAWKLRFAYRAVLKKPFSKNFPGFRRFVPLPIKFKNIVYRRRLASRIRKLFFDRRFNSQFRFRKRVFQFILNNHSSNSWFRGKRNLKSTLSVGSRRDLEFKNFFFFLII